MMVTKTTIPRTIAMTTMTTAPTTTIIIAITTIRTATNSSGNNDKNIGFWHLRDDQEELRLSQLRFACVLLASISFRYV